MKPKYSPMMMQYLKIKEENKDAILLFRLGDFYEMFFDDAITVSKELGIALTGKNAGSEQRVPMCGVPFHSSATYIQKLVDKGFRVAIAEQLTDPGSKGIVERGVIQVITPGTIFSDSLAHYKNNYIASFIAFDFHYVLAFCDVTTGEFSVVSMEKQESLLQSQLQGKEVKEVVCLPSKDEPFSNLLVSYSNNDSYPEKYKYIFENISDIKQIKTASLLLNYLLETQKRDLDHLQVIEEVRNDSFLVMDTYTKRSLELTQTFPDRKVYGSLLWLLDQTESAMGARLLKKWVESPLIKRLDIEERMDIVAIFLDNFIQRESIRQILKDMYDLERLSSRIAFGNINARDMRWIASTLQVLPELKDQLLSMNEPVINLLACQIIDVDYMYQQITAAIIDNPPLSIKEGGFIKEGYSAELDDLRYLRDHGKQWLATFEQQEREKTGIKNLKVGYNRVFGYYIEVTKGSLSLLKDEFQYTRKQSLSNAERFVTPELKEMETKIISAQDKIVKLEYKLFCDIRTILRKDVHILQDIAKIIAMVDVYQSLAVVSNENGYVRPTFNDHHEIQITNGRHGVIERILAKGSFVSNSVSIHKDQPILIITGPNMGGKSTYMRQIALLILMAQIGSFVPCDEANLCIFDQIFTRIGASDNLLSGQSTFMVEMLEANNALRYATENSLVIFDEIGRGTATYDGMAIAQGILEYIAKEIHCITLFSTHYHELTYLEEQCLGIQNVHASAAIEKNELVFLYRIRPGRAKKSYGINVASLAKLPSSVIMRAQQLLLTLEKNPKDSKIEVEQPMVLDTIDSELEQYLASIDPMTMSPIDALSTLIELKKLVKE